MKRKVKKIIEYAVEREYILPKWMYNPKSIEHLGSAIIRLKYVERLLFSHDFAKAVFGEKYVCINCGKIRSTPSNYCGGHELFEVIWQHHLQQAVISKDPIEYYYKHINTES